MRSGLLRPRGPRPHPRSRSTSSPSSSSPLAARPGRGQPSAGPTDRPARLAGPTARAAGRTGPTPLGPWASRPDRRTGPNGPTAGRSSAGTARPTGRPVVGPSARSGPVCASAGRTDGRLPLGRTDGPLGSLGRTDGPWRVPRPDGRPAWVARPDGRPGVGTSARAAVAPPERPDRRPVVGRSAGRTARVSPVAPRPERPAWCGRTDGPWWVAPPDGGWVQAWRGVVQAWCGGVAQARPAQAWAAAILGCMCVLVWHAHYAIRAGVVPVRPMRSSTWPSTRSASCLPPPLPFDPECLQAPAHPSVAYSRKCRRRGGHRGSRTWQVLTCCGGGRWCMVQLIARVMPARASAAIMCGSWRAAADVGARCSPARLAGTSRLRLLAGVGVAAMDPAAAPAPGAGVPIVLPEPVFPPEPPGVAPVRPPAHRRGSRAGHPPTNCDRPMSFACSWRVRPVTLTITAGDAPLPLRARPASGAAGRYTSGGGGWRAGVRGESLHLPRGPPGELA